MYSAFPELTKLVISHTAVQGRIQRLQNTVPRYYLSINITYLSIFKKKM